MTRRPGAAAAPARAAAPVRAAAPARAAAPVRAATPARAAAPVRAAALAPARAAAPAPARAASLVPARAASLAPALAASLALTACGASDPAAGPLDGPAAAPLDRPTTRGTQLQFRFDPDDVVETFASASGSFLIHFAREGRNAVPDADVDATGIPDFVEEVAAVYDEVLVHYRDVLGFRPPASDEHLPDNGGDGRFDVYLVDFAGIGDGVFSADACGVDGGEDRCVGFMTQENDYAGYGYPSTRTANRILGSHELFHAVQAAYDNDQDTVLKEGTAVWATESFDRSLRDFEGFVDGYLANTDRSLDVPLGGPVDPFSYGGALFFQFLEERYGEGTVRSLWERVEDGAFGEADPVWFEQLEPLLSSRAQATFAEAFVEFATWNLLTGAAADPARSYADGAGYRGLVPRRVSAPYSDRLRVFHASAQYFSVPPGGRARMTAALAAPAGDPSSRDGLALLLAARRGGAYGDVVRAADPAAGAEPIDTEGADGLAVIVVNTLQDGASRKPTLCIGTADEVAACRAAAEGEAGGDGGGGGGEGGDGGEGGGKALPGGDEGGADGGCGCRIGSPVAAAGGSAAPGGLALGASLLALAARRRGERARSAVSSRRGRGAPR
ncbi:MXAN_6640 family putative metalloprotease [Sorangium sp. So ce1024]|uniref:MXAN_6640 family putative metalloprotease n=1 Tax=Sorangium sp. So ce1024 TaxID=3133327 RepID=UPI003EFBC393